MGAVSDHRYISHLLVQTSCGENCVIWRTIIVEGLTVLVIYVAYILCLVMIEITGFIDSRLQLRTSCKSDFWSFGSIREVYNNMHNQIEMEGHHLVNFRDLFIFHK